ncbi:hypothetical protein F5Y09DRAFT_42860 [Xylaria sp. FL1042]|nr:hypothetical protein F5Y09DRAFT_42860 [Xylaria sp. FL1042]
MMHMIVSVIIVKTDTSFPPPHFGWLDQKWRVLPIRSSRTLYHEYVLTFVFRTAPNALTNLKAKFKAAFRKKDKKAKEGESSGAATEAAKTDTPTSKSNVEPVDSRCNLRNAIRIEANTKNSNDADSCSCSRCRCRGRGRCHSWWRGSNRRRTQDRGGGQACR